MPRARSAGWWRAKCKQPHEISFPPQPKQAPAAGRAALDAVITEQAQIIAYVDDYKLLMIATLAVLPLLVMFNRPARGGASPVTISE